MPMTSMKMAISGVKTPFECNKYTKGVSMMWKTFPA